MFSLLFCMHYKEHWHFRQTDHAQLLCPGWWRLLEQSVSPPGTKEHCTDSVLILGLMTLGPCSQFSEVTSFPMDNLDALPRWSPNSSPEFRMLLPWGPSLLPLLLRHLSKALPTACILGQLLRLSEVEQWEDTRPLAPQLGNWGHRASLLAVPQPLWSEQHLVPASAPSHKVLLTKAY